jgi:5-methylthioribose kinase
MNNSTLQELNIYDPEGLTIYLRAFKLLPDGKSIEKIEKAGEGNMNLTLRAMYAGGSLIVKQAFAYVYKYPGIAAPTNRTEAEYHFLKHAASIPNIGPFLPALQHHDPVLHLLVMEDMGPVGDLSAAYAEPALLDEKTVAQLINFLGALHRGSAGWPAFANQEMRALNHQHIFDLPFREDNGLDLDGIQQGLHDMAIKHLYNNTALRQKTASLGALYLHATGPALLHGDFYPGSWLRAQDGLRVIDAEFCFTGPAEFDLGVLKAHLLFCGWTPTATHQALNAYGQFDHILCGAFAGIEILRRLYGVAQLPLNQNIFGKEQLTLTALQLLNL